MIFWQKVGFTRIYVVQEMVFINYTYSQFKLRIQLYTLIVRYTALSSAGAGTPTILLPFFQSYIDLHFFKNMTSQTSFKRLVSFIKKKIIKKTQLDTILEKKRNVLK